MAGWNDVSPRRTLSVSDSSIRYRKSGVQARYAASLADITAGHESRVKLVMGEANRYCAAHRSRSFAAITPATQQE